MSSQAGRITTVRQALSCPAAPLFSLRAQRVLLKLALVVSDVLVLALAFRTAFWFRFQMKWSLAPDVVPDPQFYPALVAILIPAWVLIFMLFSLYEPHLLLGGVGEYSRIFNACTTGTMFVVLTTFVAPGFVVARAWVIAAWVLTSFLIALNRFFWRRVVYSLRGRGYLLVPTAIVGTNQEAEALAHDLADWRASGVRILGYVETEMGSENGSNPDMPILGNIRKIRELVRRNEVEDLVVAVTAVSREELLLLCEQVNNIPSLELRLSSGLYEMLTTGVTVKSLGPVPLISLNKVRLRRAEVVVKTLLEYSLAFIALVLLSPLFLLIAVLIKTDSSGPVLYRRRVLGVSGRKFDAFKFRTMYEDGDERLEADDELTRELMENHKLRQDPRVTHVGRWLRKYSLDELPQLFNVLLGQMGLVGPRMICPEEAEKYGRHKLNLLTVKPGLTGLWQVSGRSDLSYEERVRLDMLYIRNYSVWLDLQILFVQTLPAVLKSRGAY
jgi:exopolysaccharide biosynthesis polyprenyl glycosylphosphotransferase